MCDCLTISEMQCYDVVYRVSVCCLSLHWKTYEDVCVFLCVTVRDTLSDNFNYYKYVIPKFPMTRTTCVNSPLDEAEYEIQYSKSELTFKYQWSGVLVVCVCDCVTIGELQCCDVVYRVSVCCVIYLVLGNIVIWSVRCDIS